MRKLDSLHFNTYEPNTHSGYGRMATQLVNAIEKQDINVLDKSNIVFNFCKPCDYKFKRFTIGYTPWESTQLPKDWFPNISKVHLLATTSKWIAKIFREETGFDFVAVVPHGIDEVWQPIEHHKQSGPFTYIHVGEPALRKGGDIVLNAWYRHFRNNKDVHLIYKCMGSSSARIFDDEGSIVSTAYEIPNVSVIDSKNWTDAHLWQLYALSDCMVYPSRGEGFGLIPFEAIASGLPTIIPKQHIGDFTHLATNLLRFTKLVDSDSQAEHPGKWLDYNIDELIWVMSDVRAIDYNQIAYDNALRLHNEFDWDVIVDRLLQQIEVYI